MALRTSPLLYLLTVLTLSSTLMAQTPSGVAEGDRERVQNVLEKQAPVFVENKGQWPESIRFHSHTDGLDMWVTDKGIVYDLHQLRRYTAEVRDKRELGADPVQPMQRSGHVVRMEFVGGNGDLTARGSHQQPGRYNYFQGNDPSRWAADVRLFKETWIETIYKGIDAVLYYDGGMPRYDVIVNPGADPSAIRVRYAGAEGVRLNEKGELAIATSLGEIAQQGLFAYQIVDGSRQQVPCSFDLRRDGTVGFELGSYDRSKPLVIDPILYSTFFGGSADDNAYALQVDGAGNAYLTGYTSSIYQGTDSFPIGGGAYDFTYNGGMTDVFVTKFDCNSGALVFSTFVGGRAGEDGRGIDIDGAFNVYVCGYTGSDNFPVSGGALSTTYNGGTEDAFVFKLSPLGSNIVFSTYIGAGGAEGAFSLDVDQVGGVRVCGYTASADFPTTVGAFDRIHNGNNDIFVLSLNSTGASLSGSTFIGGSGDEYAYAIETDGSGSAFICGSTSSTNFPTAGAFDPTYNGGIYDGIIAKVGTLNTTLQYSTYIGGSQADYIFGIDNYSNGDLAFCGHTASSNFPTTGGSYSPIYNGGASDGVVGRLAFTGSSLVYSTYIGGASDDYAFDIQVDNNNTPQANAFVCGKTASEKFPTTAGAYTIIKSDLSYDGFLAQFNPQGSTLLYSTFIGGANEDWANALVVTDVNTIYLAGTTHSRNYPTTWNAFDDTLGYAYIDGDNVYSYDAFVTKLDVRNVSVTEPTAAMLLCPGSSLTIKWSAFRVGNVAIRLSSDGGATFPTVLAPSVPANTGTFTWTVPATLAEGNFYRIKVVDASNAAISDSNRFNLIVPPPLAFALQPSSAAICPGDSTTFVAQASGLGLRYQWRKNGVNLAGARAHTLTVRNAAMRDTGRYQVIITDTCGKADTSDVATLALNVASIVTGPVSDTACVGTPASFSVTANVTGGSALYQWQRNGADIPGANGSTYTIPTVTSGDAGNYTVTVISDVCPGTPVVSQPVTLIVESMTITGQPQSHTKKPGESVIFTVTAPGAVSYQWRKDGVAIPGAIGPSYTISALQFSDSGNYDVIAIGRCFDTSNVARLVVNTTGAVPGTGILDGTAFKLTVAPNPASGRTTINILPALTSRQRNGLELALYDVLGRKALDLTPALVAGGYDKVEFDAASLPEGVYYCRLSSQSWTGLNTMVIIGR